MSLATPPPNLYTLTKSILTRFPRELRDTIYSHVWDPEAVDLVPYMGALRAHRRQRPHKGTLPELYPEDDKPNFLNHRACLVPRQFAAEAVAWLYSDSPFEPVMLGLQDLPMYLKSDVLDVGVTPGDKAMTIGRMKIKVYLSAVVKRFRREARPFDKEVKALMGAGFSGRTRISVTTGKWGTQGGPSLGVAELYMLGQLLKPVMAKVGEVGGKMEVLYSRWGLKNLDVTAAMGGTPQELRRIVLDEMDVLIAAENGRMKKAKLRHFKGWFNTEYHKGVKRKFFRDYDDMRGGRDKKPQQESPEEEQNHMDQLEGNNELDDVCSITATSGKRKRDEKAEDEPRKRVRQYETYREGYQSLEQSSLELPGDGPDEALEEGEIDEGSVTRAKRKRDTADDEPRKRPRRLGKLCRTETGRPIDCGGHRDGCIDDWVASDAEEEMGW